MPNEIKKDVHMYISKGTKRNGAGDGIRTHDLLVTSQLLYQLELLRQVLCYYIMKCVKV